MDSQIGHFGVGYAVALSQEVSPHQSGGPHFAGLLDKFDRGPEAHTTAGLGGLGQIYAPPSLDFIEIFNGIGKQYAQLLIWTETSVGRVIAGY